MTTCVCGRQWDLRKDTTVLMKSCRCGLPPRVVTFGAPTLIIKQPNPERAAAGLPDKTDLEKYVENPPAWH
jgi:hypothetical protein